ncbi:dihydrolipoamide acetyltransferase family protein [Microbacterium halophytorum]|uniref:dihydrolipoamide acetyltransferase family protein n=1 Tax=Microbacterium halophytorum TaxID=2067568 RepID=UPI000CFD362E|nr:dihydrolipoamide acetyltransferase family protein [Microbacterium halophytorum]
MSTTFRLPDLGEGLTESTIVEWRVAEGDTVAWGDVLAEVETAKAVVDLPSPHAGVVARLRAGAGDTVEVGAPIVDFDLAAGGGASDDRGDEPERSDRGEAEGEQEEAAGDASGGKVAVLVGSVEVAGAKRPKRKARTFAQEPFSREEPARSGAGAAGPRASHRERVAGLRRRTAEAMVASAFTAPQASCFLTVDVTETLRLVDELRGDDAAPSFFGAACRAVVIAAGRTPGANASFHDDAGEIEFHAGVNLGVAVATDRGLVVASVDDADRLDAAELTAAIAERAAAARDGSIGPSLLTSSTITVSNVGVFGVDGGVPILNPGQSAIVAVGAVRRAPHEHDGAVALRNVCTLTVSFDHRVMDGREASGFLTETGALLERPGLALVRG